MIEVYRAERGGGKTNYILSQCSGLFMTEPDPRILIVVPTQEQARAFVYVPIDLVWEENLDAVRGREYDYVFVDNADMFQRNPMNIALYAPGAKIVMTYTPLGDDVSSLPKDNFVSERPKPTYSQAEIIWMMLYLITYHNNADDGLWFRF